MSCQIDLILLGLSLDTFYLLLVQLLDLSFSCGYFSRPFGSLLHHYLQDLSVSYVFHVNGIVSLVLHRLLDLSVSFFLRFAGSSVTYGCPFSCSFFYLFAGSSCICGFPFCSARSLFLHYHTDLIVSFGLISVRGLTFCFSFLSPLIFNKFVRFGFLQHSYIIFFSLQLLLG